MKSAVLRWTIYLLALFALGPVAGLLTGSLRGLDGGPDATPLVCSAPVAGILAGVAALAIALAVGLVGARLVGVEHGYTAAGLVLAWAAWRTGEVSELIRTAQSGAPLRSLTLEGVLFGALALGIAWALAAFAKRPTDAPEQPRFGSRPLGVLVAGFLAAGVGAWLVAVTPLKGQAVAAAIAGGILAAAVGRLVDLEAPLPILVAPVLLVGIVAPLTGFITRGTTGVVAAAYAGTLFPTSHITPLDFIAGAFLGVPVGISWATSMGTGRAGP